MKAPFLLFLSYLCILITTVFCTQSRPNIVLILSDDQAWTDYGFMGHPDIKTPHLDQLASESLVFEKGYVASPLCRPSLATMITGLYPFQHKITGNDVDGRNNRAALDLPLRNEFHQLPSFIKQLKENGYLTHQSGKWWEGSYSDGGFTHGMTHGNPKKGGRHGDLGLKIGRNGMEPIQEFIDHALGEKKPFFVWYAPFLPHTPHNPPERFLKKYNNGKRSMDVAKYYAMCEWFDETCGELTDLIKTKGVKENTIFLYICDNGWAAKSTNNQDPHQRLWSGYALKTKGSPYEMGIRTPIMISWPKHLKPSRSKHFAHAIDLYPTIATAAGLPLPKNLTGINLLNQDQVNKREIIFGVTNSIYNMTTNQPSATTQYLWCIKNNWKLLLRFPGLDTTKYKNVHIWDETPIQLYDLENDPHEKNNLAQSKPKLVQHLKQQIEQWHRPKFTQD